MIEYLANFTHVHDLFLPSGFRFSFYMFTVYLVMQCVYWDWDLCNVSKRRHSLLRIFETHVLRSNHATGVRSHTTPSILSLWAAGAILRMRQWNVYEHVANSSARAPIVWYPI